MNQPIKQMFGTAIRGYSIPQVFREKWFANFQMDRSDQHTLADNIQQIHVYNSKCYEYSAHENDSSGFLFTNKSTQLKQFFSYHGFSR